MFADPFDHGRSAPAATDGEVRRDPVQPCPHLLRAAAGPDLLHQAEERFLDKVIGDGFAPRRPAEEAVDLGMEHREGIEHERLVVDRSRQADVLDLHEDGLRRIGHADRQRTSRRYGSLVSPSSAPLATIERIDMTASARILLAVWVALAALVTSCQASSGSPASSPPVTSTAGAATSAPAVSIAASPSSGASESLPVPSPSGPAFALTSPAFKDGGPIPIANTCNGAGRSPELRWSGAPAEARAFVLEVIDVDAGDFVHWLVFDLPGGSTGSLPAGVGAAAGDPKQGLNSRQKVGWTGPCPPSGKHRYVFTLIALAAPLGLSGHPDRATLDRSMVAGTVLGKTTLSGTYARG